MNLSSYLEPPDPIEYVCDESGSMREDCDLDHDGDDCPEREPCNICGGVTYCRCDDAYEEYRESRWED